MKETKRLHQIKYSVTELPNKSYQLDWIYRDGKPARSALQLAKEARRTLLES